MSADLGLSHIALPCTNLDASIAFYRRFADMEVVHRRGGAAGKGRVAWLSDRRRAFAIVLIESGCVAQPLAPPAHLGVGMESRAALEARLADAAASGIAVSGPYDSGPPVGFYAILRDPDGHTLELSHGQEVGTAVRGESRPRA